VVGDAATIVSELVTNAIVHGSGHASLVIEVRERRLHVEVLDTDPTVAREPLNVEPSAEHGRGLAIVNALASSCGVEPRLVGKAVWFDLDL
jgi:anti-sigma regulatory factor (Ser/Thr protein kinase)